MPFIKNKTRRLKFWWHLSQASIKRYRLRFIIFLVLVFLIAFILAKIWPALIRSNIITIGYVGTYTLETIPTEILSLATQSLISTDAHGKPIPSLASHWTISEDGKTYVVFLKDNLSWYDATPVKAEDISIAISNVKINSLNNKVIEFVLPNPISSFPLALDKPVFKTKSFYGTGEYGIVKIDKIDNIIKRITLNPKDKSRPKVEIRFYQTEDQTINALKVGEIKSIDITHAHSLEIWPNLEIQKNVDNSEIITIFYNNEDPLLSSKDLRQALSYAIERSSFDGANALSPISPSSWAFNETVKKYEYNMGKAKELIAKSNLQNPKIILTTNPELKNIAQQIKQDWELLGIATEIRIESSIPKNFQALLAINKLNPDPDQYSLWHSTQKSTNITKYKNVKIDKLLEDARTTSDENKRKELYSDFQKFLMEDAPATFIYHPYKYQISYKNIRQLLEKLPNANK